MQRLLPALLPLVASAALAQVLQLHYQERPPYSSRQPDGTVAGLVATPAATAMAAAGIDFRWVLTPSQRQLALIRSGQGPHCGIGWFRSAEREASGRFSAPLYRDRPFAALVREGSWPAASAKAADLVGAGHLRLLVKDGYSYGPMLDRLIAEAAPSPQRTAAEPTSMGAMLRSGRADWMIVAPEEAALLGGPGLRLVTLTDVPEGATRHLYCSTDLPSDWMRRIDRSLATMPR